MYCILCSIKCINSKIPMLCILHPGHSIKFSVNRTDLGNKANRGASCAFGEVCLLTGRDSEHTLRHRDRDHYWAVCHRGNCSCPYTARRRKKKKRKSPTQRVICLFHQVLKSLLKCDHLERVQEGGGFFNSPCLSQASFSSHTAFLLCIHPL